MTLLMGRVSHDAVAIIAWVVVAVIIGATVVVCVMPDRSSSNVIATRGVPSLR
jgi:hypothetical protein